MMNKGKRNVIVVGVISLLTITMLSGSSRLMCVALILAGCALVALGFAQTQKDTLGRKVLLGGLSVAGVAAGIVAAFFLRS
jgi:hypothetical protein